VSQYVTVQGQKLSTMIRKGVETPNWIKRTEPRHVRLVVTLMLKELDIMSREIIQFFKAKKERTSTESRAAHAKKGIENEIRRDIDMLFQQKVQMFGAVEFNKLSILTGIVKICLKTFVECIRLQTFGQKGFQQIQVDAYYMRVTFKDYVNDEGLLEQLLDNIITSTADRCLDPVKLNQSVIASICGKVIASPPDESTTPPLSPRGTISSPPMSPRAMASPRIISPRIPQVPKLPLSPRPNLQNTRSSPRQSTNNLISSTSSTAQPSPRLNNSLKSTQPENSVQKPKIPSLPIGNALSPRNSQK